MSGINVSISLTPHDHLVIEFPTIMDKDTRLKMTWLQDQIGNPDFRSYRPAAEFECRTTAEALRELVRTLDRLL